MSLSAASRHPVGQTIKTLSCVQSLWMRTQWSRTTALTHTPVCASIYWCHTNSVTQSSDNRWNVSLTLFTPFSRSPHFSPQRQTFVGCNPPLFRSHSLHTLCWTLLCFSIYYFRLSAVLSEKSVSPARAVPLLLSVASHLPAHFIPGPPSHTQSFSLSSRLFIRWKPGSISPHPSYGIASVSFSAIRGSGPRLDWFRPT